MTFDYAPGDCQRQPETASRLIEGDDRGFVRLLEVPFARHDDHSGRPILALDEEPVYRDDGGRRLFAQRRAEKRRKCGAESGAVPTHARTGSFAAEPQMDTTIFGLLETVNRFMDQLEQIETLHVEDVRVGVQICNFTQLVDQRDNPRARFLRFIDHLALPIAQRVNGVMPEHAQIAGDDVRGSTEFVRCERQQLSVLASYR
jgi:hypothetical protein